MNSEEEKIRKIDYLIMAVDRAYSSPKNLLLRGLLLGLASGLGATIGVAIVLSILSLVVRELGGVPVIGEWLVNIDRKIPTN